MGSWQLFRLPRVTLPSFSQIGDGPETPSLDLLDPIKKHLLKEPRHCLTAPDFGQACISISPAVSFVVPFYVQGVAGDSEGILVES